MADKDEVYDIMSDEKLACDMVGLLQDLAEHPLNNGVPDTTNTALMTLYTGEFMGYTHRARRIWNDVVGELERRKSP